MKTGYIRFFEKESSSDIAKVVSDFQHKFLPGEPVFFDVCTKKQSDFPELDKAINSLNEGDIFVISSLANVASSLIQLIVLVQKLSSNGVFLFSVKERLDTRNDNSKIFPALFDFHSSLVKTRTAHGLVAARTRGKKGGRPGLSDEKINRIKQLHADPNKSIAEICDELKIHPSTLYKYINKKSK